MPWRWPSALPPSWPTRVEPTSGHLRQRQLRALALGLPDAARAMPAAAGARSAARAAPPPAGERRRRAEGQAFRVLRDQARLLLRYFGTTTLIVTGLTGDRCVLFTASDVVHNRRALGEMARLLNADLMGARHLALSRSGVRHLGSGVRRLGSGVRRLDSAAAARPRSARAPAAWTPRRPPAPAA